MTAHLIDSPSHEAKAQYRWPGAAGIGFFVLFALVMVISPDVGNPGDSAAVLRADLAKNVGLSQVFTWITGFQILLLLTFAAGLSLRLRAARQPLLANLGLAGAVALVSLATAQHACVAAMQYLSQAGHPQDVQLTTLNTLSYAIETVLRFPMALFIGALALGILRSRILPRWLGLLGVVESLLALIAAGSTSNSGALSVNGPVAVPSLLLLLIWILATGIALIRTPAPDLGN